MTPMWLVETREPSKTVEPPETPEVNNLRKEEEQ